MRRLSLTLLIWIFSLSGFSQYYNPGQEPFGTRWCEHKNDSLYLIFPKGSEAVASDYLQYHYSAFQRAMDDYQLNSFRIPVILHPSSILSNGFVVWTPRRVELVTTPDLDNSSEPWLKTLAIHETRHVVQIQSLNKGVFRVGSWFLGEQSVGMASALLPTWFYEGDAVWAETKYSNAGRGRMGSFYRQYMAVGGQYDKGFSYSKWMLGSYKHHIPNHYSFGYMMVGYNNLKHGPQVWLNAIDKTAKRIYYILPFQISFRQQVKHPFSIHLIETFAYCDSLWLDFTPNEENISPLVNEKSKRTTNFIEYEYPFLSADSTIITLKTTLSKSPKWVEVNALNQKERTVAKPGYLTSKPFVNDSLILWSQYVSGVRWEYKNYSDIWVYNRDTNRKKRITKRTKLFNPLPIDANRIAAIALDNNNRQYISILDSFGNSMHEIWLDRDLELKELSQADSNAIIVRCASPDGILILKQWLNSGRTDTLLGPIHRDISQVVYNKGLLYFTLTENYREQLVRHNPHTGESHQISQSRFGLSNISIGPNNQLTATVYNSLGSTPCLIEDDGEGKPLNLSDKGIALFFENSDSQPLSFESNPNHAIELVPKKRSLGNQLFNLHSWAPLYYDPFKLMTGQIEVYPGVTVLSQNHTGTLVSGLSYSYNKTHGVHAFADWLGWFPKLSMRIDYGNQYAFSVGGPTYGDLHTEYNRPNLQGRFSVSLPLVLSSGYVMSKLTLATQYLYENGRIWDFTTESYQTGVHAVIPYFNFLAYNRMAHRHIRPQLGISLFGAYYAYPSPNQPLGDIVSSSATIYLPGISSSHSLMVRGQYEKHMDGQYLSRARANLIRGQSEFWGREYAAINADYALPLLYPDLELSTFFYFKRVILNGFYDMAFGDELVRTQGNSRFEKKRYSSTGLEITTDFHFLRIEMPIRVGYRGGYNLQSSTFFHNFILEISLASIYNHKPNLNF